MADAPDHPDTPKPQGLLQRARAWTSGNRTRSWLIGLALGLVTVGTISAWLVLANLAVAPPATKIEDALAALDDGDVDGAEALAERMQAEATTSTEEFGGPLFVIGAVRAMQADGQWSEERRNAGYLIASRYLAQAKNYGFPEGREAQGLLLLGESLVESDQLEPGIEVLDEALAAGAEHAEKAHRMLSEALFFSAQPLYRRAAEHAAQAMASGELTPEESTATQLRRAQCLTALGKYDEALSIALETSKEDRTGRGRLIEASVRLARMASSPGAKNEREIKVADEALDAAIDSDRLATRVTAAAQLLQGKSRNIEGKGEEALDKFIEVRSSFPTHPEGVAAAVAEADYLRTAGEEPRALDAYRRALSMVSDTTAYRNEWLPIAQFRAAVLAAQSAFVTDQKFDAAAGLVEQLATLFGKDLQLELQARTLEAWGRDLLGQPDSEPTTTAKARKQGRQRLREAGVAYERLAAERYSSNRYPEYLWSAAEVHYLGQSFTSAERNLREYLRHEPVRRNAEALLRLGQAMLAQSKSDEAVETFKECIEFNPGDVATYQARLDCAMALQDLGKLDEAESMLRFNLEGSTLTPRSPEWRDSKFRIGRMLHFAQRYDEAIIELEEATGRYPEDPQARLAKYLVADSYRHAAEAPMKAFDEALTVNEREKNKRLVQERLTEALRNYESVQREITLGQANSQLDRAMLRNCYMLKGAVLFDLERYQDAAKEYSNVSTLFQNEPFVLETLVQVSNCWRRLNDADKARGALDQAFAVLDRLPPETDFAATTMLSRAEWESLLTELKKW